MTSCLLIFFRRTKAYSQIPPAQTKSRPEVPMLQLTSPAARKCRESRISLQVICSARGAYHWMLNQGSIVMCVLIMKSKTERAHSNHLLTSLRRDL